MNSVSSEFPENREQEGKSLPCKQVEFYSHKLGSVLNIELILLVNCGHKQGLHSNDAKAGIFGRGPSTSNFCGPRNPL